MIKLHAKNETINGTEIIRKVFMVDKITQYFQFFTFVKNSKYITQNTILNYVTILITFLIFFKSAPVLPVKCLQFIDSTVPDNNVQVICSENKSATFR